MHPSKSKGLVRREDFLEVRSASCNMKEESAKGRGEQKGTARARAEGTKRA